jgi:hypothetical protein
MVDVSKTRPRARSLHGWPLGVALTLAGCRIGGDGTDPFAKVPAAESAAGGRRGAIDMTESGGASTGGTADTAGATDSGGTTQAGGSGSGGAGPSIAGAAGAAGRGGGGDSSVNGAGGTTDTPMIDGGFAGVGMAPGTCQPAVLPAVCDPVRNVGCLVPFSSCDVDPTQAVPAGRCVFPFPSTSPDAGAGACQVNVTTETCLPMSTCVNGGCRKLCYCDSDCLSGECCTEPAPGPSAVFKLCGRC